MKGGVLCLVPQPAPDAAADVLRALAVQADGLARLALTLAALANPAQDAAALVPVKVAARFAATSPRTIREAIRRGELAGYGRERDRAVRRADLEAWIEERRVKPVAGVDDGDIDRRVKRLRDRRAAGAR